ncbi:MAG: hypothetical protein NC115_05870 [Bacteroidales bacterium]|nr:hypothetical protein [Bacteroides sp.]MCM1198492.1 hypothetical protein [Clostridium sp.]MCM1502177.1 hypothetical protein [Bacteroidales bacterium]
MTLLDLVKTIAAVAINQPTVQMVVENDISKLENCTDVKYGVFGFSQGEHAGGIELDAISYGFSLYYIDKISGDNSLEIQSTGIVTLTDILQTLPVLGINVGEHKFTAFEQKFIDNCAGVRCDVILNVESEGPCPEFV